MREIVLDTETTGLDPNKGDRLVEIGCIELLNRIPTGNTFHAYLNPDRDMPAEAFNIHGLSIEFLKTHKRFPEIVRRLPGFHRRRHAAGHPQRQFRSRLSLRRAQAHRACADRARTAGRYVGAGAAQTFGRALQSRCAVRQIRHRQFAPHQARRAARRRNSGRSLSGADRRAAGVARPGRKYGRAAAVDARRRSASSARGRAAAAAADARPNAPRIANSSRRSAKQAVWRNYRIRCGLILSSLRRRLRRAACAAPAPFSGGRARRNRPGRAAAAGSRHCAPWWR